MPAHFSVFLCTPHSAEEGSSPVLCSSAGHLQVCWVLPGVTITNLFFHCSVLALSSPSDPFAAAAVAVAQLTPRSLSGAPRAPGPPPAPGAVAHPPVSPGPPSRPRSRREGRLCHAEVETPLPFARWDRTGARGRAGTETHPCPQHGHGPRDAARGRGHNRSYPAAPISASLTRGSSASPQTRRETGDPPALRRPPRGDGAGTPRRCGHLEDAESLPAAALPAGGTALPHGCVSHPVPKVHSPAFIPKNSSRALALPREAHRNPTPVRVNEDLSGALLPEELLGSHGICFV